MSVAPLAALPAEKQALLQRLVEELRQVDGVQAIVLGGSYARGVQRADSDLDIGLYYDEAAPFAIETIRAIARSLSSGGEPTVTGFYEWGAWVNGGAWIQTAAGKVDFLYRNLDQVQRTIAEAQQGILHHDYGQQPAYGFYSVIYLAETQICLPLFDPHGQIERLKAQVASYPPLLKSRTMDSHLWSAEFTLIHARSFADQGDVYTTVGCLTRAAANLTQVLFALNEVYFIGDKRAMAQVAGFRLTPPAYGDRLAHILAQPGATRDQLSKTVADLSNLWQEVVALTGTDYQPKFILNPKN
jgi:predicted nucleotidyltransferase